MDELLTKLGQAHILVVGDLMLDRFVWGEAKRISPEAPVPVVKVTRDADNLGGAANVVANVRALGGRATPVGYIGDDEAGRRLRDALAAQDVADTGLATPQGYRTIQKTRIIAGSQHVVRVDREEQRTSSEAAEDLLLERITALLPSCDAVILSDYAKGVVSSRLYGQLRAAAGDTPVHVDPKDPNFDVYQGADLIKPNQSEAEQLAGHAITDQTTLRLAAQRIHKRLAPKRLLITRGKQGMALFENGESLHEIPTKAREVFDVSGAGDTVIAVYTLAVAVGATAVEAAALANAAAGVVVGKQGTATLSVAELRVAL